MAQLRALYKAYKTNQLLDRLAFVKKNAVRAHYGLPPIVPWYEKLYVHCMDKVRINFLQCCCPCVLYLRNRRLRMRTCCGRLCLSGTYENQVLRSFFGFFAGLLLGLIFYAVMIFKMEYSPPVAMFVCIGLACFLSISLAFSYSIRCFILLVGPQFFSSRGRTFLIIYAFMLVMAHPVKNAANNVVVLSDAATCGQSMAYNQTKEFVDAAMSPMVSMMNGIRSMIESIKIFANALRNLFLALKDAVDEIVGTINKAINWLTNMVKICNDKMLAPYRKCTKAFDNAYDECMKHLDIIDFVCEIVDMISYVCEIVRLAELLCILAGYLKDLVSSAIGEPVKQAIYHVYDMFYVNISVHYHYNLTSSQSKTYDEVREAIMDDIKTRVAVFDGVLDALNSVLGWTVVFVLVKAIFYRQKYLNSDSFDNIYITKELEAIDEKRKKKGKETIMPLSKLETLKYIKTWTFFLTLGERRKMLKGIVLYISSAMHAAFYLMCDFGLYWMLDMVRRHFNVNIHKPVPPIVKMHVQGNGIIADMYRALVSVFDPLTDLDSGLNTSACLPNPSEPNFRVYKTIGMIYGVCFFLTVFEAYALRLRHIVMGMFFPKRAKHRAAWLYDHIIKKRGGLLKFTRRQLRRKYRNDNAVKKASIRGALVARFPFLERFVRMTGYDRKRCLCCGDEGRVNDYVNFYHCSSSDCDAVYCSDCYTDINNMCTVCMKPVDYGDVSDQSEEVDSSGEDEEEIERKKRLSEMRRARLAEREHAQRPEVMLSQFKGFAEGTVDLTEDKVAEMEEKFKEEQREAVLKQFFAKH